MTKKFCKECGIDISNRHHLTVFCSKHCKYIDFKRRKPESIVESNKRTQAKRVNNGKAKEYRDKRRNSKEGVVDRMLESAKSRDESCDLDREYIFSLMEDDKCNITSVPFDYKCSDKYVHNSLKPSIDRIDSKKGYLKGNVQIVLLLINRAKNEDDMSDFLCNMKKIVFHWEALTK